MNTFFRILVTLLSDSNDSAALGRVTSSREVADRALGAARLLGLPAVLDVIPADTNLYSGRVSKDGDSSTFEVLTSKELAAQYGLRPLALKELGETGSWSLDSGSICSSIELDGTAREVAEKLVASGRLPAIGSADSVAG
jgi:hypothetical protein